jgi:hypothetical protein
VKTINLPSLSFVPASIPAIATPLERGRANNVQTLRLKAPLFHGVSTLKAIGKKPRA